MRLLNSPTYTKPPDFCLCFCVFLSQRNRSVNITWQLQASPSLEEKLLTHFSSTCRSHPANLQKFLKNTGKWPTLIERDMYRDNAEVIWYPWDCVGVIVCTQCVISITCTGWVLCSALICSNNSSPLQTWAGSWPSGSSVWDCGHI